MNIAVVNPNLDDSIGGGEAVSLSILKVVSEKHEADYFTKNSENIERIGEKFGYSIPSNASINHLPESKLSKLTKKFGKFTLLRKLVNDRKITKHFNGTEYDAVIFTAEIFDTQNNSDNFIFQYVHSGPPSSEDYTGLMSAYLKLCRLISPQLNLMETEKIIYNSENLRECWGKKGKIIYPPIKKQNKNAEKEKKAIAVGRISPDKNLKEAIEISEKANIDLTIAGLAQDDEYLQELFGIAENKKSVEIKTDLPREELNQLISESKIGLLCRRNEPLGMVVVEYMKAGVLPMVRNEGGPKEIVPGGEFTYDKVEEASEKIQSNLENFEKLQEKIDERSKDFSEEKFRKEIQEELEKIL